MGSDYVEFKESGLNWLCFLNCGVKLLVDVHVSSKSKPKKKQSSKLTALFLMNFFLQQVFLAFPSPLSPSFLPSPFNCQRGLQLKCLSWTKESAVVDETIILCVHGLLSLLLQGMKARKTRDKRERRFLRLMVLANWLIQIFSEEPQYVLDGFFGMPCWKHRSAPILQWFHTKFFGVFLVGVKRRHGTKILMSIFGAKNLILSRRQAGWLLPFNYSSSWLVFVCSSKQTHSS